jgi:hypothetical protein
MPETMRTVPLPDDSRGLIRTEDAWDEHSGGVL